MNPPLLIPKPAFEKFESRFTLDYSNHKVFLEQFKFDDMWAAQISALTGFHKTLHAMDDKIFLFLTGDLSFKSSLSLATFNEESRFKFLKNAAGYFDDLEFQEYIAFNERLGIDKIEMALLVVKENRDLSLGILNVLKEQELYGISEDKGKELDNSLSLLLGIINGL
jgi:hypothetical protein